MKDLLLLIVFFGIVFTLISWEDHPVNVYYVDKANGCITYEGRANKSFTSFYEDKDHNGGVPVGEILMKLLGLPETGIDNENCVEGIIEKIEYSFTGRNNRDYILSNATKALICTYDKKKILKRTTKNIFINPLTKKPKPFTPKKVREMEVYQRDIYLVDLYQKIASVFTVSPDDNEWKNYYNKYSIFGMRYSRGEEAIIALKKEDVKKAKRIGLKLFKIRHLIFNKALLEEPKTADEYIK